MYTHLFLVHTMWGVNVRTIRATFSAAGGKKLISVSEKAPRPGDWAIACDGTECVSSEFETSKTKTRWHSTLTLGGEVGDDMVSVESLASMPAAGNRIPNSLGKIRWIC